jgi:hypothetical protein
MSQFDAENWIERQGLGLPNSSSDSSVLDDLRDWWRQYRWEKRKLDDLFIDYGGESGGA